jgi:short-subunit dehydrogenase
MAKILILGACSAIAEETARLYAKEKAEFFLVARNQEKLTAVANDLKARGADACHQFLLDLRDTNQHEQLIENIFAKATVIDIALIAHGSLSDEIKCQESTDYALAELEINLMSPVSLLLKLEAKFKQQRHGTIAIISSVAGDRGRKKVAIYGTAKAGLTYIGQALAQRLAEYNVKVLTIKPGIINTPMTASLESKPFAIEASAAAQDIYQAIKQGKILIYTPRLWRFIMLIIRSVPQFIYLKMKF